jgi:hypothetical protein
MLNDVLEVEELSTEEKTRFSNNLRELNKSSIHNGNIISTCTLNSNSVEETKKICYKHISKTDFVNAETKILERQEEDPTVYYWFAAYDKLIKLENLQKIFEFYGSEDLLLNKNFKEQSIILKDYEIYFDHNFLNTKPLIRQKQVKINFK